MPPVDRRTFVRGLSAGAVYVLGGCAGRADEPSAKRPIDSRPIRTVDPVRTEGTPIRVSRTETKAAEPEDVLRSTVSDRTDCLRDELPVQPHDPGLLVRTETVVRSLKSTDVVFPSPAYDHLKRITPRSIVVASSGEGRTATEETPVYIDAILRQGDSEELLPRLAPDC